MKKFIRLELFPYRHSGFADAGDMEKIGRLDDNRFIISIATGYFADGTGLVE